MATYTGTPRTWVTGETATETKMNTIRDALLSLTSTWAAYTPTVSQGASSDIAKTIRRSEFRQSGKDVSVDVHLEITGTGTAGGEVHVTLPVDLSYNNSFHCIGAGIIVDSSGGTYACVVSGTTSAGEVKFRVGNSADSGSGVVGTQAAVTLASGDIISFNVAYESV